MMGCSVGKDPCRTRINDLERAMELPANIASVHYNRAELLAGLIGESIQLIVSIRTLASSEIRDLPSVETWSPRS